MITPNNWAVCVNWATRSLALGLMLTLVGSFGFANEEEEEGPTVFLGGGFSRTLLENISCAHLHSGQKLSVNPVNPDVGTTQAERQFLIQLKMFKCVPDIVHEVDRVIEENKGSLDEYRYTQARLRIDNGKKDKSKDGGGKLHGDDKFPGIPAKPNGSMTKAEQVQRRRERKAFKKAFRAKQKELEQNGGGKVKKVGRGAAFSSSVGPVKYLGTVNDLIIENKSHKYNPSDAAYPWAWPKNAINDAGSALEVAFGSPSAVPGGFPADLASLITPKPTTSGFGHSPPEEELKRHNVFFEVQIPGVDANSGQPGHRASNGELCRNNYQKFLAIRGQRDSCAESSCLELETLKEQLKEARRNTIATLLTEIRYLRREHSEAQLCLVRGDSSCSNHRSLDEIARAEKHAIVVCGELGFPLMSGFSTKIHASKRSFSEVCKATQRADHAHRGWARAVREGHTVDGFNQAWISMLGHSVIRANMAMPFDLDFDRAGFNKGGALLGGIFELRDREVEGNTNTACPLGPVE